MAAKLAVMPKRSCTVMGNRINTIRVCNTCFFFFHSGFNDVVRCYVCDGGLQKWSPEDNPWVEHARWFSHCAYVRQIKGEDFIELVRLSAEHQQLEEVKKNLTYTDRVSSILEVLENSVLAMS